jgi:enoyl-CoA hydratase/carnithine racemase
MSILVSITDRVATVTIDRVHRRNAVDTGALEELIAAV